MILVIDNYDSFTFNLVQQLSGLANESIEVVRNDEKSAEEIVESKPNAIVISPGPGTPEKAGCCVEVVKMCADIPLLGVCLGHQAVAVAFGARVTRGRVPVHGKAEEILHRGEGLFEESGTVTGARYHSLLIDPSTVPDELSIDATTRDGAIMAISHKTRPVYGLQFHPESFGTTGGERLVRRFLQRGGVR